MFNMYMLIKNKKNKVLDCVFFLYSIKIKILGHLAELALRIRLFLKKINILEEFSIYQKSYLFSEVVNSHQAKKETQDTKTLYI